MSAITRIFLFLLALLVAGPGATAGAEKKLKVVASFSILGDLVKNVGGDRVAVTTLVGPNGDVHVYEPTPADARAVSEARLVVINGLGLEGWMDRLIRTSGYKGPVVVATQGVKAQEAEEGQEPARKHAHKIDPHAWQNVLNGEIYVEDIAKGLSAVDPEGAPVYQANAAAYNAKLDALDRWVKAEFSTVPKDKRRMITTHDAFGYLARAYGITIFSPEGMSTESEPSAAAVAGLIQQIRRENITAVFIENVTDPRLTEEIARESGVKVGGELYSDALSPPDGPAPTYIDMFKNNVPKIVAAMRRGL